jgi:hypothetical protein
MTASLSSVLSGSAETAACKSLTTSNRFWLICGRTSLIPVVGAMSGDTSSSADVSEYPCECLE